VRVLAALGTKLITFARRSKQFCIPYCMINFGRSNKRTVAVVMFLFSLTACILISSCSNPYKNVSNTADDYQIIPQPNELVMESGRFLVQPETKIVCETSLVKEATYLANLLGKGGGSSVIFDNRNNPTGNIILFLDSTFVDTEEGYTLRVKYDGIVIMAKL